MAFLSAGLSVAAYLPRAMEVVLRDAIREPNELHLAKSWASLNTLILQRHVDLVFADPSIDDPASTETIARLIESFPSVAFVAYTALKQETVYAVYELAKRGLHRIILHRLDDHPARIAALLNEIPARQLLPTVMFSLRRELAQLPKRVRNHVENVFAAPMLIRSVDSLARCCGTSRPNLYEIFQKAELGSPRRVLVGARLLRAYLYLRDPGHSFSHVAMKTGWSDPRILRRHLTAACQMQIPMLRHADKSEEVVNRIVEWMRKGAA